MGTTTNPADTILICPEHVGALTASALNISSTVQIGGALRLETIYQPSWVPPGVMYFDSIDETFKGRIGNSNNFQDFVMGQGTPTQIAFFDSSSTISSNAALYWATTTESLGIGTTTPNGRLTIYGDAVYDDDASFVAIGGSGSGNTFTAPAASTLTYGSELLWHSKKSAFRAGSISGGNTAWDEANIGTSSVAFGNNTLASGAYSAAFGNGSTASGINSFAAGNAEATANAAVALWSWQGLWRLQSGVR